MPETVAEKPVIAKVGVMTAVSTSLAPKAAAAVVDDKNTGGSGSGDAGGGKTQAEIDAELLQQQQQGDVVIDDKTRLALLKELGFEGTFDEIKDKLKPADPALTPEQILQKEKDFENRMLTQWIANGQTAETFVNVKQLMSADPVAVSSETFTKELIDEGFSQEEATAISKQVFLQEDLDAIEKDENESNEAFEARKKALEKKVKFGAKNLANRSLPIIEKAKGIYESLKQQVLQQDQAVAEEAAFSAQVDTHIKTLPKEMKIVVGKLRDSDEAESEPVTVPIPESVFTKVSEVLKDPAKRNALLYDDKGNLDIKKITDILVKNELLESGVKSSLIEGSSRQVKIYEKVFPARSAQAVGVGGGATAAKTTGTSQPVKAGTAQRV